MSCPWCESETGCPCRRYHDHHCAVAEALIAALPVGFPSSCSYDADDLESIGDEAAAIIGNGNRLDDDIRQLARLVYGSDGSPDGDEDSPATARRAEYDFAERVLGPLRHALDDVDVRATVAAWDADDDEDAFALPLDNQIATAVPESTGSIAAVGGMQEHAAGGYIPAQPPKAAALSIPPAPRIPRLHGTYARRPS